MTESLPGDITVRFAAVTKAFGPVVAVQSVSFEIRRGHLVTLLGPSGCGKTTTLRMIAGLELPTSGRVFIGDRDVTNLPATDRDVAMVFQSYALFPHMSVLENVGYGLKVSGRPKAEVKERASGRPRPGRPGTSGRAAAVRAVGRPAAAGRRGARRRPRARGAALRRAALQPRRQIAPPGQGRDPRAAAAARPHRGLRHP